MKTNNLKLKIYKIIFVVLLIIAIIIIGLIIYKYGRNQINEKETQEIVNAFRNIIVSNADEENAQNIENTVNKNQDENQEQTKKQLEYKGYKVIGIVKIDKINIEYPILEIGDIDPENAKTPMQYSIIKYWGENVNDYGNLSIAGHNYIDGTMFGKTKYLEIGDIVELTDLTGRTIQYSIYNIFVTEPNDVSILLPDDEQEREVTLITYSNGNKNRLIIKAKEVEN